MMTTHSAETPSSAPDYVERLTCRLCHGHSMERVIDFGNQYLVNFVKERNDLMPRVPLVLMRCPECGLLQLGHTANPKLLWTTYWYQSGVNQTMRNALRDVVGDGTSWANGGSWLDIGANDGTLLSYVPKDFRKVGVEPTDMAPLCEEHADLVVKDFFKPEHFAGQRFEVITSCAMFYDLDDPHPFVEGIADLLAENGVWINQLSNTPDMINQNAFDNVCHEHVCYYDIATLNRLYGEHGLKIVAVSRNDVNGGSIRVTAKRGKNDPTVGFSTPATDPMALTEFADRTRRWKDVATRILTGDLTLGEDVWLYGASTKACMMLQYLDLNERFLACADRNPRKNGLLMAGTWIPISDEATMRKARPRHLFVGPWAFRDEFVRREASLRAQGTTMHFPLPNYELVL